MSDKTYTYLVKPLTGKIIKPWTFSLNFDDLSIALKKEDLDSFIERSKEFIESAIKDSVHQHNL